jgi:putative SOS response-associated peptidase YedK
MCARFTLTLPDYAALARALGVEIAGTTVPLYHPSYNAAPAETQLVLRVNEGKREIVPARWGLVPRWAKDPQVGAKMINARSETVREKPAFRDAFAKRRCVVPADGFYEWGSAKRGEGAKRGEDPKGARTPFWFHPPDRGLLYMAGLYESWKNPETGLPERTFTILTTPANEVVRQVHDRMPALLDREALDAWLRAPGADDAGLEAQLRPASNGALVARRVSIRVNSVANDDPTLIEEVRPEEPARQTRVGETLPLFKLD